MENFDLRPIAVKMLKLYVSNYDRAVIGGLGGYSATDNIKITTEIVKRHLEKKYSLSVFASPASSRFVCFDVDTEEMDDVYVLIDALTTHGFPEDKIYVSSSGNKGFHVEMFFDDLVPTKLLERLHKYICSICEFDPHKVEFRPTYTQAIKLPLSEHPLTRNMCWYLDAQNGLMSIQDMNYVLGIQQIPKDEVVKTIFKYIPEVCTWAKREEDEEKSAGAKVSVPHISDTYPTLTERGTRHAAMLSIAIYERQKGTPQDEIMGRLVEWAKAQDEGFINTSERGVFDDAAGIAAWVWSSKFVPPKKDGKMKRGDFERVMSFRHASDKKVGYLLLAADALWGYGKYSLERLAHITGLAQKTVATSLARLEESGVITKKRGRKMFETNSQQIVYTPNIYYFNHAPYSKEGDEIIDVDLSAAQAPDSSTYNELYLRAVAANVGEERWRELFTKKERDALYDYV